MKKKVQEKIEKSSCRELEIERAKLEEILFGKSVRTWTVSKIEQLSYEIAIEAISYLTGTEANFNKLMDDCRNSDHDWRDAFSYSFSLRDEKFKKVERLSSDNWYFGYFKGLLSN